MGARERRKFRLAGNEPGRVIGQQHEHPIKNAVTESRRQLGGDLLVMLRAYRALLTQATKQPPLAAMAVILPHGFARRSFEFQAEQLAHRGRSLPSELGGGGKQHALELGEEPGVDFPDATGSLVRAPRTSRCPSYRGPSSRVGLLQATHGRDAVVLADSERLLVLAPREFERIARSGLVHRGLSNQDASAARARPPPPSAPRCARPSRRPGGSGRSRGARRRAG